MGPVSRTLPKVAFIVGPTASGKTEAALRLAKAVRIEVINADSRQVYRGMSIGTAKPSPEALRAVPHHLIDVADPGDTYSLARFLRDARSAIDAVTARGALPVVVGGTGQYVWGLVEGWQVPEVAPQPELRERLAREAEELGHEQLHGRLAEVDPEAAASIDPRNVRRVIRALEVWEVTGRPFSAQRQRKPPGFVAGLFGLRVPREELRRRIVARIDRMLEQGWLAEVRALLDAGYTPDLPSFSSAGYREMAAYLAGEVSLDEAKERTAAATARLVRMQATWFREDDPRITWVSGEEQLVQAVVDFQQRAGKSADT